MILIRKPVPLLSWPHLIFMEPSVTQQDYLPYVASLPSECLLVASQNQIHLQRTTIYCHWATGMEQSLKAVQKEEFPPSSDGPLHYVVEEVLAP